MFQNKETSNTNLYASDRLYLIDWKQKMIDRGIEVITLLGNHDAPYLIEIPADFSASDEDLFFAISDSLYELGVQVAYKLDDYIVSHAGVVEDFELEDWYFRPLSISDMPLIEKLQGHVGFL